MVKAIKLTATAHYLPSRVVTNDELSQLMDTSDEWIQAHTGIRTRHFAIGEDTSDMALKVAQELLATAGLAPTQIDLIIVSTITPNALTPSTAAIVQGKLGATNAFAYDLSAACAGFIFASTTATKFLRTGGYRRAMVISAETNSKMLDFHDRTSAVFFGDGAAGAIYEASDDPADEMVGGELLETQGDEESIHSGRVAPLSAVKADNYPRTDAFYQDGHAVYEFVTQRIPEHIAAFLQQEHLTPADVDFVIPHQANLRLIEQLAERTGIPLAKFAQEVTTVGNLSSVGIPLALDRAVRAGKRPQHVLLTGFGAGLAYASMLLDLSKLK